MGCRREFSHLTRWLQQQDDIVEYDATLSEGQPLPVMLACNDERGNTDGLLRMIELHDALTLEHPDMLDDGGFPCTLTPTALSVAGETFALTGHRSWVGNICWECVWMDGATLLRFLRTLQQTDAFECTEGQAGLYVRWRSWTPLTSEDIAVIRAAASTFRF